MPPRCKSHRRMLRDASRQQRRDDVTGDHLFFLALETSARFRLRLRRNPPCYIPRIFSTWPIFFLNFSTNLFALAFSFQVGIVGRLSNFFLNFALHFVKLALGFVLCALPHGCSPSSRNLIFAPRP